MDNRDVIDLANLIYAENASEDFDTMWMTGSSVIKRMQANKPIEFGSNIPEISLKGYKSVQNNTPLFQQAFTMNFPDEKSKQKYLKAMQISYGLNRWQQGVENYTGNIDLLNRPIVRNPDGSFSTEISKSFNFDGKEVLIPTIVNGKRVSDNEAIEHYKKTGEHLGIFNSPEEANAMAEKIHSRGIPPMDLQFFFKKGEALSLRKKLKFKGKVGKYDTYSY
jgi:hypothetical protein